jgi:hypothetical protein
MLVPFVAHQMLVTLFVEWRVFVSLMVICMAPPLGTEVALMVRLSCSPVEVLVTLVELLSVAGFSG